MVTYVLGRLAAVQQRRLGRDTFLVIFGVLGLTWETVQAHPPNDALITVFGSLAGAPFFLRADERRTRRERSKS